MTSPLPSFGARCEALAAGYMVGKGLVLEARNFRTRFGEIDLVLAADATIVFVEVKARHSARYGAGCEAVGWQKQRRIMAIAACYMARHPGRPYRFDVVSVAIEHGRPIITHFENAFP